MIPQYRALRFLFVFLLMGAGIAVGLTLASPLQELSRQQRQSLRRIKSDIDKAGRLYNSKKYEASAKAITSAQERIQELTTNPTAELLTAVLPEYERMAKAHELLTNAGQTLPELQSLPAVAPPAEAVSFRSEVAPLLVARCGRCHVNQRRGNFSAASFQSLLNSTMVSPGLPDRSRIVEVIVDGDMPPGGSLQEAEVTLLKNWIQQGAKFDGEDPGQNLNQLARNNDAPANRNRRRAQAAQPTGNETVSFGLHVAPILLESCGQCHIDTNRPRGNFSMANFARLLRGGDSGAPLEPSNTMDSLILQKMKGTDGNVMPPSGKLDDKVIAVIETWIKEGAKFDGDAVDQPLNVIAAKALANSQTHQQLIESRSQLAEQNWKLVMSDAPSETVKTDDFRIVGELDTERLTAVSRIADSISEKLKAEFKAPRDEPLLKGNTTVFVLERRYDLSELGTMLARREIPKEVKGYWNFTTIDAYISLLLSRNKTPEEIQVQLAQQIAAVYVSSLSADVPRWFADGVGYWVTAKIFSREDEVKTWEKTAQTYSTEMQRPDDFITGRLPDHKAALVSYLFIQQLRGRSGNFRKLMTALQSGSSFDQAFTEAYGQSASSLLGTNENQGRRRRRR